MQYLGMGEVQWGPGTLSAFLMILYLIFCIFWDVFNFVCVPVIFKLLRSYGEQSSGILQESFWQLELGKYI